MAQYEYMDDELEIDLLKLLKALWKKAWLIVLVAAIFGGAMFAHSKIGYVPTYTTKTTLYANYINNRDFAFGDDSGNISQTSLSESRSMINTCIAVLNTRMTLEQIIETADLDMTYSQLSPMLAIASVNSSELFTITVTGTDPEQITTIANTAAEVLPENVMKINPNSTVAVIDTALVPTAPSSSDSSVKDAAIGAVLGAMLVCGVVVVKEIYIDWKAFNEEKKKKKEA